MEHKLSAAPFHVDQPWYPIEADAREVPAHTGRIVLLCSDNREHEADREGNVIRPVVALPNGVTIKAWRLP